MKHAGADALATLAPLLDDVRRLAGHALVERKPGTFYRRSVAFLHFHEDPAGMFADLKGPAGWERFEVTRASQQAALLRVLKARLA